jgi:hypothetical protein
MVAMDVRMRQVLIACGAILGACAAASGAPADSCKSILQQFKGAADRANREVTSTLANLQEVSSKAPDDKRRMSLIAQSCAASAEAAGVLKSYRIVIVECVRDRDPAQWELLDRVDRSISQIRVTLDKTCR